MPPAPISKLIPDMANWWHAFSRSPHMSSALCSRWASRSHCQHSVLPYRLSPGIPRLHTFPLAEAFQGTATPFSCQKGVLQFPTMLSVRECHKLHQTTLCWAPGATWSWAPSFSPVTHTSHCLCKCCCPVRPGSRASPAQAIQEHTGNPVHLDIAQVLDLSHTSSFPAIALDVRMELSSDFMNVHGNTYESQ